MLEIALVFIRVCVGLFFAISGFHKLTVTERHNALVATLKANRIPFVGFNQYWVPFVEFSAGLAVVTGVLFPLPLLGLLVICLVACLTDGSKRIAEWKPINKLDVLDDWLYLPEVLYILLILLLLVSNAHYEVTSIGAIWELLV